MNRAKRAPLFTGRHRAGHAAAAPWPNERVPHRASLAALPGAHFLFPLLFSYDFLSLNSSYLSLPFISFLSPCPSVEGRAGSLCLFDVRFFVCLMSCPSCVEFNHARAAEAGVSSCVALYVFIRTVRLQARHIIVVEKGSSPHVGRLSKRCSAKPSTTVFTNTKPLPLNGG